MTEAVGPDFAQDELWRQAAGNCLGVFFGAVDYLREQGLSPEEFAQWLGRSFAPGWEGLRGDVAQIAYVAALNEVSLGATLRRYDVGENEATIEATTAHLEERADESRLIAEIFRPIMAHVDVDYALEQGQGTSIHRIRRKG